MADVKSNISLVGLSGAVSQIVGTIIYSKLLVFIPIFNFFPLLIASLLFLISGILWTIEILTEDLPHDAPSRSQHLQRRFGDAFRELNMHTLNTLAGLIAIASAVIGLLSLYLGGAAAAPLFWSFNVSVIICCVGWYMGSTPPKGKAMTTSDRLNQIAAVFQVLAIGFMVAATYVAAPVLSYSDLSCALFSGVVWAISYCLPNNHDTHMALMIESIHGVIKPPVIDHTELIDLRAPAKQCTNNPYLPWGYIIKDVGANNRPQADSPSNNIIKQAVLQ